MIRSFFSGPSVCFQVIMFLLSAVDVDLVPGLPQHMVSEICVVLNDVIQTGAVVDELQRALSKLSRFTAVFPNFLPFFSCFSANRASFSLVSCSNCARRLDPALP